MLTVTAPSVSVPLVAPAILVKLLPPFVLTCHWNVRPDPVAITLNVAFKPAQTAMDNGWAVTATKALTVSMAAADVIGEAEQVPVSCTLYKFPFMLVLTAFNVSVLLLAPATFTQVVPLFVLICHWYIGEVPVAVALKEVLVPSHTVLLTGDDVITIVLFTESMAALEVTGVLLQLKTLTRYRLASIPATTFIKFSELLVAPATSE